MQKPKMLTITQTAKEFNLPKNFIRQAVLDGRIVHVKAGKKHLINAQKVEEWLNAGDSPAQSAPLPQSLQSQNQVQSPMGEIT
jgi:excisionase family DNA binding protein